MSQTTTAPAKKPAQKKSAGFGGVKQAWIIIALCIVVAELLYFFLYGSQMNFKELEVPFAFMSDEEVQPANLVGTVYMGGFVVPIIHGLFLTVVVLVIERFLALKTAFGKMNLTEFTAKVRKAMATNDIAAAYKLCDQQQGSVANVVRATLERYEVEDADATKTKAQKLEAIKAALDDATALEMPTLQMNLPILGVLTSLGVLFGLFGTVLGMIKSFQSLASAGGGADSSALSVGISEALINTASGIATSVLAVIFYNFYTNKIDKLTYTLDEVGFILVQNYATTH